MVDMIPKEFFADGIPFPVQWNRIQIAATRDLWIYALLASPLLVIIVLIIFGR
jgi:hypothetical protein